MNMNKRVFRRIIVPTRATLLFKGKSIEVDLRNLSLQGATIETNEPLELKKGISCRLRIVPEGIESELELEATVVHVNKARIGLQFSENKPKMVKELLEIVTVNFENADN